jgi:hypothetical protein
LSSNSSNSKAICILGMHRSGTSTVSRAINLLGGYLGEEDDLYGPAPDNPEGYWERKEFVDFNDRLLGKLKRTWDTTLPLPDGWFLAEGIRPDREELTRMIKNGFSAHSLWAWKDPRVCVLFPMWKSILEELAVELVCVFCVRNPVDVANSLRKRDNIPLDKGFGIWFSHNILALQACMGLPTAFVCYDNFLENWEPELRKCAKAIHVAWPVDQLPLNDSMSAFIRPSLRHNRSTSKELDLAPAPVKSLYHILNELANSSKVIDDTQTKVVESLSREFNSYASFSQHDSNNLFDNIRELSECRQQISEDEERINGLNRQQADISQVKAELDQRLAERESQLEDAAQQSEKLHLTVKNLEQKLAERERQLDEGARLSEAMQINIGEFEQELVERERQLDDGARQHEALQLRTGDLGQSLIECQMDLAAKDHLIRDIYESLSWKVTAPLRGIYDKLHLSSRAPKTPQGE